MTAVRMTANMVRPGSRAYLKRSAMMASGASAVLGAAGAPSAGGTRGPATRMAVRTSLSRVMSPRSTYTCPLASPTAITSCDALSAAAWNAVASAAGYGSAPAAPRSRTRLSNQCIVMCSREVLWENSNMEGSRHCPKPTPAASDVVLKQ